MDYITGLTIAYSLGGIWLAIIVTVEAYFIIRMEKNMGVLTIKAESFAKIEEIAEKLDGAQLGEMVDKIGSIATQLDGAKMAQAIEHLNRIGNLLETAVTSLDLLEILDPENIKDAQEWAQTLVGQLGTQVVKSIQFILADPEKGLLKTILDPVAEITQAVVSVQKTATDATKPKNMIAGAMATAIGNFFPGQGGQVAAGAVQAADMRRRCSRCKQHFKDDPEAGRGHNRRSPDCPLKNGVPVVATSG